MSSTRPRQSKREHESRVEIFRGRGLFFGTGKTSLAPSALRDPLPENVWEAILAIGFSLAFVARGDERVFRFGATLGLWLVYLMILRPGELMEATSHTLTLATEYGLERSWIILIVRNTKNARSFGFEQML